MTMIHSLRGKNYDNDRASLFCPKYFLNINSFGDIYPCCHQILSMKIGNVCEPNIVDKIVNYKPEKECKCSYVEFQKNEHSYMSFLNVNLELAGECNGNCAYCFQKDLPTFKKSITIYDDLEKLLRQLKPRNILVIGGEVGVQRKTIELLLSLKSDYNPTINIATNGNIKKSLSKTFNDLFETVLVTFNGFTSYTVKMLSGLDFLKQKRFCEQAIQNHLLSVKFIITPLSLLELPLFLLWALEKPFQHIIIEAAYAPSKNYSSDNDWGKSMLETMTGFYWEDIFLRISKKVKSILENKAINIIQNDTVIMISKDVETLLGIDKDFYYKINILGQLTPKNVCISHKAWRSLLK